MPPTPGTYGRKNFTIRASSDSGATWPRSVQLCGLRSPNGSCDATTSLAAYSSLTSVPDPAQLPLARLNLAATVGQKAIGAGDIRGAADFVDRLATAVDLGKDGVVAIGRFSGQLIGSAGTQAAAAEATLTDATARRDDAVNRRDNFSGVNIDEELAQMVVLQNSYSAAARVLTTASQMYDTLIAMVG